MTETWCGAGNGDSDGDDRIGRRDAARGRGSWGGFTSVVAVGGQRRPSQLGPRVTAVGGPLHDVWRDRRGRGASDDLSAPGADDLAREVDDLHAIIGHVGEAVHVLAHSGGAVCALDAALQGADVRTLLLYEPPLDVSPDFPRGLGDRLQRCADTGDMEGLLVTFLREGPRVPDAEITAMRASPSWQARLANSMRIVREVRLVEGYQPDRQRLRAFERPVLLLVGSATPAEHVAAVDFLAAELPNARVVTMQGQGHVAMLTAPEVVAREVISFD